eukprot:GHVN01071519.1.p1 GENE.GHVN01071519.1~~GHVN01071519.1.p1  ORF type:complete len:316 (+),score=96.53 GHVN01071519.1:104-949(+)
MHDMFKSEELSEARCDLIDGCGEVGVCQKRVRLIGVPPPYLILTLSRFHSWGDLKLDTFIELDERLVIEGWGERGKGGRAHGSSVTGSSGLQTHQPHSQPHPSRDSPPHSIVQSGVTYVLYCILIHTGESQQSGHYTAVGRSSLAANRRVKESTSLSKTDHASLNQHRSAAKPGSLDDEWLLFDDSHVRPITLSEVDRYNTRQSTPYVLFYARQDKSTNTNTHNSPIIQSTGKAESSTGTRGVGEEVRALTLPLDIVVEVMWRNAVKAMEDEQKRNSGDVR